MSRTRSDAVATLARWRALQEAVAEGAARRAVAGAHLARDVREAAEGQANAIDARCVVALGAGPLDLAMLGVMGALSSQAREVLADREAEEREANDARDGALAAQYAAHVRTRVVTTRHARLLAEERDADEKRLFDRMAALIAATPQEGRHD